MAAALEDSTKPVNSIKELNIAVKTLKSRNDVVE